MKITAGCGNRYTHDTRTLEYDKSLTRKRRATAICHELGHILFDSNYYHYIYNITNNPIFRTINNVYDSFINYSLVINPNVPEYAKVLYRGCLDIKINISPNLSKFDGYQILGFYCLLYLSLNYVLPDRESFTSKK